MVLSWSFLGMKNENVSTYKWSSRLKPFPQVEHLCFRSSVCVNLCLAKALLFANVYMKHRMKVHVSKWTTIFLRLLFTLRHSGWLQASLFAEFESFGELLCSRWFGDGVEKRVFSKVQYRKEIMNYSRWNFIPIDFIIVFNSTWWLWNLTWSSRWFRVTIVIMQVNRTDDTPLSIESTLIQTNICEIMRLTLSEVEYWTSWSESCLKTCTQWPTSWTKTWANRQWWTWMIVRC